MKHRSVSFPFLIILLLADVARSNTNNTLQPRHHCIPKSAESFIQCPAEEKKWGGPGKYCGSTRGGAVFWADSSSPISSAANSVLNDRDVRAVRDVHETIEFVVSEARRSRAALYLKRNCSDFFDPRGEYLRGSDENNHITKEQQQFVTAGFAFARRMQLNYPVSHCFSMVKAAVDSKVSLDLFATLARFSSVLEKTGKALYERVHAKETAKTFFEKLLGCWPHFYSGMDNSETKTDLFRCRVLTTAGIRHKNGQFAIPIDYTDAPHSASPPEHMRLFIGESWYLDNTGTIRSHADPAFRRGQNRTIVRNTTTTFSTWGGRREMARFFLLPTRSGPAIRHVLNKLTKIVDNVRDSLYASNVAIMVLPAIFVFIPISFIEFVGKRSLFINIIFSDVIPVLSLAIKGGELIYRGSRSHTGCVAYTLGAENGRNELAIVELWCAKCEMYPNIVKKGIAFLVGAILLMILGIWIELVAYRSLRRRIKHMEDIVQEEKPAVWWQRQALRQYVRKRQSTCSNCTLQDSLSASLRSDYSISEPNESNELLGR